MKHMNSKSTLSTILLLTGIVLIAINLRPAITSVGPLMGTIRDDIGLANWNTGLITSLPLLAFAIMSPVAPKIANRLGNEKALLLGLILLLSGIGIRSLALVPALYIGTTFVGLGIAVCNVLLPGVIKEKFPDKVGLMTGAYTTIMSVFAAIASGLSVPLATALGWQMSLLIWALFALIGITIWVIINHKNNDTPDQQYFETNSSQLFRSAMAWQVTLFMGLQSFLFYVTISWLPELLHHSGISIETAGWLLSYMQFISLPVTFYTPILASRFNNQQGISIGIGLLGLLGYGGLLFDGSLFITIISVTLIGFALGACISLALAFLGMRSIDAKQAANLSGMAQSFGYLLAAIGPLLIGLLFDITKTWTVPLLVMLIVVLVLTGFGIGAGRDKYV
ncbi:MFS transporter, CP family, cyanate transporter [Salinibacillus kushneri]|uniref:MFS transporter, CP family, cyanate transporter n=1 Tax=Salinibacillus kushneri TaxID=237682 RepID=A0A1I0HDE7_9BACI|nr:MFS transporter [Salinibacillus kushneri]SET81033.1 MFS transporter, CP family, cyanate transporter [Salinibacillus kushneri]